MAAIATEEAIKFLKEQNGEVAILDGTNTTFERRQAIRDRVAREDGYTVLWVESICNDESRIERNIRSMKTKSPDYAGSGGHC